MYESQFISHTSLRMMVKAEINITSMITKRKVSECPFKCVLLIFQGTEQPNNIIREIVKKPHWEI